MASSKKNKTAQDQAIAAKRVEFVKANPNLDPAEARKRFFVQTRAAELQAKGVEVTKQKRQELRQKFATGGVQRQGFYTPGDLQRIAAAKAGGSNTNAGSSVSSSGSGQNFADYKNTGYVNASPRPVSKAASSAASKKGFDEQSFNPAQFLKSPLVTGIAKLGKGAYNLAESTAESFNATFINPTVNLVGSAIGKNPKLRQAGGMEAAVNTADVILSIATAGAAKGVTVPLKGLLPAKQGVVKTTVKNISSKIATAGSQVVRGTDDYAATALSNLGKGGKTGTVDLVTGVYKGPVKSTVTKKVTGEVVTGVDDYVKATLKNLGKGGKTGSVDLATGAYKAPAKTSIKPKSVAKPKAAPSKPFDFGDEFGIVRFEDDVKGTPKALSDLLSGPKPAAKPKATPKPKSTPKPKASTAKPAVAPKAAKPKVDRFANAWDDSPVDMSKVDFNEFGMESSKPYATGKRAAKKKAAPKVEAPPAPKPAANKPAPKTTAPKANAKAAFDKSVAPIKTGSQKRLTFKTQADYNQFLKTGGKERLRQMSPELRTSFERVNEKWIKGAAEAREATQAAQKRSVERSLATKGRYNRARPELKGLFNQALIKRQERELLAKVTKKK